MTKEQEVILNKLVRDLLCDYKCLSTNGQETLDKILKLLGYPKIAIDTLKEIPAFGDINSEDLLSYWFKAIDEYDFNVDGYKDN